MLIPRHKKGGHGGGPDPNAWMMSYADMATILLAMFIVLSTFAKDQTGISLYVGTGSFRAAVTSFGLPGLMPNAAQTVPLNSEGTQYAVPSDETDSTVSARQAEQPHDIPDKQKPDRVIDIEEENFQRYLDEVGRHFQATKQPRASGQTSLDFHDKLPSKGPFLTEQQREQIGPLMALLQRGNYRVRLIVWAGIPRESATIRSLEQASAVVDELVTSAGLEGEARRHLVAVGQSWPYRDVRRPVFSVVVMRSE